MDRILKNAERRNGAATGVLAAAAWADRSLEAVRHRLQRYLARRTAEPALAEWDRDVPPFPILSGQVRLARTTTYVPTVGGFVAVLRGKA